MCNIFYKLKRRLVDEVPPEINYFPLILGLAVIVLVGAVFKSFGILFYFIIAFGLLMVPYMAVYSVLSIFSIGVLLLDIDGISVREQIEQFLGVIKFLITGAIVYPIADHSCRIGSFVLDYAPLGAEFVISILLATSLARRFCNVPTIIPPRRRMRRGHGYIRNHPQPEFHDADYALLYPDQNNENMHEVDANNMFMVIYRREGPPVEENGDEVLDGNADEELPNIRFEEDLGGEGGFEDSGFESLMGLPNHMIDR